MSDNGYKLTFFQLTIAHDASAQHEYSSYEASGKRVFEGGLHSDQQSPCHNTPSPSHLRFMSSPIAQRNDERLPPQKTGQRCDSWPPGEVSCPASTVLAGHLSQSTIEAARPLESPQAITRHEAIPRPKRAYHAEHPIRLQREEGPSDTRGSRPSKRARTTPDSAARGLGGAGFSLVLSRFLCMLLVSPLLSY